MEESVNVAVNTGDSIVVNLLSMYFLTAQADKTLSDACENASKLTH